MPELKTIPQSPSPAPWLPSLDLHEEGGELILHAHLRGFDHEDVLISLEGNDLIFEGACEPDTFVCYARLSLPFAPQALRTVSRPGHQGLEVHVSMAALDVPDPETPQAERV